MADTEYDRWMRREMRLREIERAWDANIRQGDRRTVLFLQGVAVGALATIALAIIGILAWGLY